MRTTFRDYLDAFLNHQDPAGPLTVALADLRDVPGPLIPPQLRGLFNAHTTGRVDALFVYEEGTLTATFINHMNTGNLDHVSQVLTTSRPRLPDEILALLHIAAHTHDTH